MRTLIIVDMQMDFLPGGALAVPEGDEIIDTINNIQSHFELVVSTQDWHPQNHGSFASNHPGKNVYERTTLGDLEQILWPDHCVQGSAGARFAEGLNMDKVEAIFRKGTNPRIDSYSGFFDNGREKSTGMGGYLKDRGATEVYVSGLAGEYCVSYTILDALMLGFQTYLIKDATRPLDKKDFKNAIQHMMQKGAHIVSSREISR